MELDVLWQQKGGRQNGTDSFTHLDQVRGSDRNDGSQPRRLGRHSLRVLIRVLIFHMYKPHSVTIQRMFCQASGDEMSPQYLIHDNQ